MPEIINDTPKRVPLDRVRPHPENPRDGDVEAIRDSIEQNGFYGYCVVQESSGYILAGNHRYLAAQDLDMPEIPVVYVDVGDEEAMRILLADNRTSDVAEYHNDALADLLEHLWSTDDQLDGTGYSGDDLDDLLDDLSRMPGGEDVDDPGAETSRAEELQEKWDTERGQLWQIGRHRLLCGDATDEGDVERIVDGERADMVFTDPPYGVNYDDSSNSRIKGDQTQTAIPLSFKTAVEVATKEDARLYFCGSQTNAPMYFNLFDAYCNIMPSMLIWVKESFIMRRNNYHSQYEVVYFGWKGSGGGPDFWFGDRKMSDVWEIERDDTSDYEHPTQKPAEIPARAIRYSCPRGGIVFEPFTGSGSTIIAAEDEGRTCYAMEIDPAYCAVILERCSTAGMDCERID